MSKSHEIQWILMLKVFVMIITVIRHLVQDFSARGADVILLNSRVLTAVGNDDLLEWRVCSRWRLKIDDFTVFCFIDLSHSSYLSSSRLNFRRNIKNWTLIYAILVDFLVDISWYPSFMFSKALAGALLIREFFKVFQPPPPPSKLGNFYLFSRISGTH